MDDRNERIEAIKKIDVKSFSGTTLDDLLNFVRNHPSVLSLVHKMNELTDLMSEEILTVDRAVFDSMIEAYREKDMIGWRMARKHLPSNEEYDAIQADLLFYIQQYDPELAYHADELQLINHPMMGRSALDLSTHIN